MVTSQATTKASKMAEQAINVYYDSRGMVLLEFEGAGLELEREEAEELFVRLGHALQDMDVTQEEE